MRVGIFPRSVQISRRWKWRRLIRISVSCSKVGKIRCCLRRFRKSKWVLRRNWNFIRSRVVRRILWHRWSRCSQIREGFRNKMFLYISHKIKVWIKANLDVLETTGQNHLEFLKKWNLGKQLSNCNLKFQVCQILKFQWKMRLSRKRPNVQPRHFKIGKIYIIKNQRIISQINSNNVNLNRHTLDLAKTQSLHPEDRNLHILDLKPLNPLRDILKMYKEKWSLYLIIWILRFRKLEKLVTKEIPIKDRNFSHFLMKWTKKFRKYEPQKTGKSLNLFQIMSTRKLRKSERPKIRKSFHLFQIMSTTKLLKSVKRKRKNSSEAPMPYSKPKTWPHHPNNPSSLVEFKIFWQITNKMIRQLAKPTMSNQAFLSTIPRRCKTPIKTPQEWPIKWVAPLLTSKPKGILIF